MIQIYQNTINSNPNIKQISNQDNIASGLRHTINSAGIADKFLRKYFNIEDPSNSEEFKKSKQYFNNRVKIDTGKFCNARCHFCYYFESLKDRDFLSLDEVKDQGFIQKLLELGVNEFEFSGGEPTLNWELQDIIDYIKVQALEYNIVPKFSIVSNGWKLKEFIDSHPDISEVLISLHGEPNHHNQITKISGSQQKIIEFIKYKLNDHRKGKFTIRINTVVDGKNLTNNFMNTLFALILNGIQVNFLPLNYWSDASNNLQDTNKYNPEEIYESINKFFWFYIPSKEKNLTYIIRTYINNKYSKPFVEEFQLTSLLPETLCEAYSCSNNKYKELGSKLVNIRYAEICRLSFVAKDHTINHLKHFFDKSDWNKLWYPNDFNSTNPFQKNNYIFKPLTFESFRDTLTKERHQSNYVDKICKDCRSFKSGICDGLKLINQTGSKTYYETIDQRIKRTKYVGS